ncbi:MAG TPA: hypothetical protein VLE74_03420 [Candidatus Saccharimonadales bacterium]|nr:hypothetical protein [Candidatus Saccharimonadales bacterium]
MTFHNYIDGDPLKPAMLVGDYDQEIDAWLESIRQNNPDEPDLPVTTAVVPEVNTKPFDKATHPQVVQASGSLAVKAA